MRQAVTALAAVRADTKRNTTADFFIKLAGNHMLLAVDFIL